MRKRIILVIISLLLLIGCSPRIKKGQTWCYYGVSAKNPFEAKKLRRIYFVLDVEKGWVKFYDLKTLETESAYSTYFKIGSELCEIRDFEKGNKND